MEFDGVCVPVAPQLADDSPTITLPVSPRRAPALEFLLACDEIWRIVNRRPSADGATFTLGRPIQPPAARRPPGRRFPFRYATFEAPTGTILNVSAGERRRTARILAHWEQRWRDHPAAFDRPAPDEVLDLADELRPRSRVLVLADGSGRESNHLAQRGHRVTATEWCATAVHRATEMQPPGHRVARYCADLVRWVDTTAALGPWDAVVSCFGTAGTREDAYVAHRLRSRLAPGAAVLIVGSAAVSDPQVLRRQWGCRGRCQTDGSGRFTLRLRA